MSETRKPAIRPVEKLIKPDPNVIETLENLLRQAQSGEIRAVAYACQMTEFRGLHGYARADNIDELALIGELAVVQQKLTNQFTQ